MTCFCLWVKKMKPRPEEQTPCHSSFSAGVICGPHRGSFAVRDHLRSNLGIISGLGIICGRGSFAALFNSNAFLTYTAKWFEGSQWLLGIFGPLHTPNLGKQQLSEISGYYVFEYTYACCLSFKSQTSANANTNGYNYWNEQFWHNFHVCISDRILARPWINSGDRWKG